MYYLVSKTDRTNHAKVRKEPFATEDQAIDRARGLLASGRAGRPGTTCRTGSLSTIGPSAFRSRPPRWTCSKHGSAICSMNCSGLAGNSKREHPL